MKINTTAKKIPNKGKKNPHNEVGTGKHAPAKRKQVSYFKSLH